MVDTALLGRSLGAGTRQPSSRSSWGQYKVPQAFIAHFAAVKFGSPQAFLPLQSVISPLCFLTGFIFGA